jgi:hypothetical protein
LARLISKIPITRTVIFDVLLAKLLLPNKALVSKKQMRRQFDLKSQLVPQRKIYIYVRPVQDLSLCDIFQEWDGADQSPNDASFAQDSVAAVSYVKGDSKAMWLSFMCPHLLLAFYFRVSVQYVSRTT